MKKFGVLLLVVLNMVACRDNTTIELTAAQQVEKRLASTKLEPAVAPAAILNQHMQATPGLAPLNQAGELFAQQTQKIAAPIEQILQEGWGTELQSKQTSFNGQHITYQYQLWKVKPKSVCSHIKHEVTQFSACTLAAKDLFHALCNQLQKEKRNPDFRIRKLHSMYCQAVTNFRPTIAQISRSQILSDKDKALRQQCNDAIIRAMISGETEAIKQRDKACSAFKKSQSL